MAKRNDILNSAAPEERPKIIRDLIEDILGTERADSVFEQLAPLYDPNLCQPGDCHRAEDNYWGGVWQVHRADEANRR